MCDPGCGCLRSGVTVHAASHIPVKDLLIDRPLPAGRGVGSGLHQLHCMPVRSAPWQSSSLSRGHSQLATHSCCAAQARSMLIAWVWDPHTCVATGAAYPEGAQVHAACVNPAECCRSAAVLKTRSHMLRAAASDSLAAMHGGACACAPGDQLGRAETLQACLRRLQHLLRHPAPQTARQHRLPAPKPSPAQGRQAWATCRSACMGSSASHSEGPCESLYWPGLPCPAAAPFNRPQRFPAWAASC